MMRSPRFTAVWSIFCLLPVLLLGCGEGGKEIGPTGEVEGSVTLDGKPLGDVTVAFYDKSTGNTGGGEVGADGKFKFTVPVPVGTYQVSFPAAASSAPAPDDPVADKAANEGSKIPQAYQAGDTSQLTAEVKEGTNTFTFELKKTGP